MKRALEHRHPGLEVAGTNFPPTPAKALASKAVSLASLATIGTALAGHHIYPALGFPVLPDFVKAAQASSLQVCMAAWFLGSTVQQNLVSTGAFEAYYDGRLVFSKLATGQAPNLEQIVRALGEAHLARQQELGATPEPARLAN